VLPGTRLVRAFNTLGYMIFAREANRPDPKLAIPIAGDDAEAVQVAAGLVRDAGFDPVLVGKLADARRFQRGAPGYGQAVTAAELKQKLSLAP
jgi:predicted dinucleotide-binding enzyme